MARYLHNINYNIDILRTPFYSFLDGDWYFEPVSEGIHSIWWEATTENDSPYYFKDSTDDELAELLIDKWYDYYLNYVSKRYFIGWGQMANLAKDSYQFGALHGMIAAARQVEGMVHDLYESYTPGTAGREFKVINWLLEIKFYDAFKLYQTTVSRAKKDNGLRNNVNKNSYSNLIAKYKDDKIVIELRMYNCSGTDWHWEYPPLQPPRLVGEPWEEDLYEGNLYIMKWNKTNNDWDILPG